MFDERRQLVEEAGHGGFDRPANGPDLGVGDGRGGDGLGHRRAVYGRSGDLYSADRAPHRDPAPRGPQPLPPGADRQDRGHRRATSDVVRPAPAGCPRGRRAGATGPGSRRADARPRPDGLGPPAPSPDRCGRLAGRRARRPRPAAQAAHHRPPHQRAGRLDRRLSLARARAGAGDRRGRLALLRPGPGTDHAGPSQPDRDTRARPHPSGRRHASSLAARCRPAVADHQHQRHQRQDDHDPDDRGHPARRRPTGRLHDLGRRAGRRPSRRARRLDRTRRRQADPRSVRRRRGRPGDRARRHPAARRRLRVERCQRADQRQRRPPRPAGHPYAARAGRGQGRHHAHHAAGRAGRAQRR